MARKISGSFLQLNRCIWHNNPFKIEYTFIRPTMFVISNQGSRLGSADKVVLPVPDKPKKKIAVSPCMPTFAEQCMESTSFDKVK